MDRLLGDLGAAGRALRRREVSSLELTRRSLERLDRVGRRLNAVAALAGERAETAARAADRELARGLDRGPLHGLPYGVKDAIAARGMPTRWGAPPYRHQVIDADATVVRRLAAAGAILVAKLALIELAGAGLYRSPAASIDGPCGNPWDPARWSGGSSSGSAAAVAAGLLPFALGTETRGSIVIPAAFCGITGFRPTYGLVSRSGVMTAAWSMDKVGPLARSASACARVLAAIAGPDPDDPTTGSKRVAAPSRELTVGVLPDELDLHPETERALTAALAVLRQLGGRIRRIALPGHDYAAISQTIVATETAAAHEALIRSDRLEELVDPAQVVGLRSYLDRPGTEYARAIEARVAATRDLARLFDTVDVLVAPTVLVEAPPIATDLRTIPRLRYAVLGAVAGVPGVSLPMGIGPNGLPLGLSLTGPRFGDRWLLRLAARFQSRTEWHRGSPVLRD